MTPKNINPDPIYEAKMKYPKRWKWYSFIARIKIKISVCLYELSKKLGE